MSGKSPTTKIRLTIMELTKVDGETSGSVELSVTEDGHTRTTRREIGKPAKAKRVTRKDQP